MLLQKAPGPGEGATVVHLPSPFREAPQRQWNIEPAVVEGTKAAGGRAPRRSGKAKGAEGGSGAGAEDGAAAGGTAEAGGGGGARRGTRASGRAPAASPVAASVGGSKRKGRG